MCVLDVCHQVGGLLSLSADGFIVTTKDCCWAVTEFDLSLDRDIVEINESMGRTRHGGYERSAMLRRNYLCWKVSEVSECL